MVFSIESSYRKESCFILRVMTYVIGYLGQNSKVFSNESFLKF